MKVVLLQDVKKMGKREILLKYRTATDAMF